MIILRDINVDFLSLNSKRIILNNVFKAYGLRQIITDSTRTSETSSRAKDFIAASKALPFLDSSKRDIFNITDHLLVF